MAIAPLVAIIIVGVCVGFLPFNWHPAKIIMGDAGALFLGVLLAVPTITIGGRTDFAFSGNTYFFFAPLAIPVIILSGMERPDIIRRSRAAGCQYFVRKPYDPNALLILVQHAIGETRGW